MYGNEDSDVVFYNSATGQLQDDESSSEKKSQADTVNNKYQYLHISMEYCKKDTLR